MRIALFTSNRTTIPPQKNIIAASAYLTGVVADKLFERGHEVTLYAPKGSSSKARLVDLGLPPSNLDFALTKEEWVLKMSMGMKQIYLSKLYEEAREYDIIHLQTEPIYLGMPFAQLSSTPTVFTNHNPFLPQEKDIFSYYHDLPLVTISKAQRTTFPSLNYVATVYDGLEIEMYPFIDEEVDKNYMLFMGRLVAVKGVSESICVSQKMKRKLIFSGVGRQKYIDEVITPHLTDTIRFVGPVEKETDTWFNLYVRARLTLFPIMWEEPFGLVMIESMACGTPVVAFARGSVPEVIKDGETGFIVNPSDNDIKGDWVIKKTGIEGLCEAVERIYSMPEDKYLQMRRSCRAHVEEKFTIEKMVDEYEIVYQKVIQIDKSI